MRDALIKNYHVWGSVSRGGMAEVWLARHVDLAIPVVIKTLLPSIGGTLAWRHERMLHEARLTARLTSPRIVRVIDVGVHTPSQSPETDPLPFLVEEYVDGIDLAEFEQRRRQTARRPLPLWLVTGVLAQAAEGLHSAHQGGVIHCDVKPSNLFGHGHARVKVGDFGVAVASTHREASTPAGTPGFMAPEQWMGEPLDRSCDVYALGATGYALRYGRLPFASSHDALDAEVPLEFPPAATPEESYFQHVLARMLSRRREARFHSMTGPWHQLGALSKATRPKVRHVRTGLSTFELGSARISIEVGDLTRVETDAIVNSATSDLSMRESLANALRLVCGDEVEREAMEKGPRPLGDCIETGAGRAAARAILHAVGGWKEVSCVARATHRALWLAEQHGFARIAFPAIATGTHGVSIEACADAMISALRIHLALGGSTLREVRFVLASHEKWRRFLDVAAGLILGGADAIAYDDAHDAPTEAGDAVTGETMFAAVSPVPSSRPRAAMDPER